MHKYTVDQNNELEHLLHCRFLRKVYIDIACDGELLFDGWLTLNQVKQVVKIVDKFDKDQGLIS